MPNISFTATPTSQELPLVTDGLRAFHITNMGTNPVTLKFSEAGSAVYGAGVILPFQYATFSYESGTNFLGKSSVISSGGNSDLAIFYI